MSRRQIGLVGTILVVVGVVLLATSGVFASNPVAGGSGWFGGMMDGNGHGPSMMGGPGRAWGETGPQPGDQGFVAGTVSAPRVISIVAGPGYTFSPSTIAVQRGETITFEVTTMGPLVHEFMVGPAAAVAADQEGTPEIADIGMMQTKSLIYTFDGSGPYAFACHAPGHHEAGMKGTITIVG